jgi:hypothetical protein
LNTIGPPSSAGISTRCLACVLSVISSITSHRP